MERLVAGCLITLVLTTATACAGAAEERDTTSPSEIPAAKPEAATSELEALAVETLSEYLFRPKEEIELVSLEPIDWPDSSIGCPRPDFSYLQVITPGHVAVLRAGGETYRVHMARNRAFVCDRPAGEVSKDQVPTVQLAMPREGLEALARADLARRLGVPVEEISVTESRAVTWRDLSLGCPQSGQTYKSVASKGYVFTLTSRGRTYAYHADRYRVLPCPPIQQE